MALSKDDLLRRKSEYATCNLLKSVDVPGRYVPGPLLWNHIFTAVINGEGAESAEGQRQEGLVSVDRCAEILRSLAQFCHDTEVAGSNLRRVPFGLEGFEGALRCVHSEGSSFQFSSEEVTRRCLHVAGIICLNSYVLSMGDKVASRIPDARAIVKKWEWNGDSGLKKRNEWNYYFSVTGPGAPDAENAMKLLYQWTLLPIMAALDRVRREVMEEEHSAKFQLASKRSDEYCHFLIQYRELFGPSKVTEFLYTEEIYRFLRRTAQLYIKMGKTAEAKKLLMKVTEMLDGVREKKRTITDWGKSKLIHYVLPDDRDIVSRVLEVINVLQNAANGDLKLRKNYNGERDDLIEEELENDAGCRPKVCLCFDWSASQYPEQIYRMFSAFGFTERLNEAREIFGQLQDPKYENLNARLREFLYSAVLRDLINHSCSGSKLEWESVRLKQDFLLDVCEALDDLQLTAKCLVCCASMMFEHTLIDRLGPVIEHAQTLEPKRFEEELNNIWSTELYLQLFPPAPECVQKLISCINDPWKPDEHERGNLPDMLKAIRFTKRSIDIYSDLLHKHWAEVTSNEDAWLKLLESQKDAQNLMLAFHNGIVDLCKNAIRSLLTCSSNFSDPRQIQGQEVLCLQYCSENVRETPLCCDVLHEVSQALLRSALVWIERGRARTLMQQLGRGDGAYPGALKEELNEFDNNYETAQSEILSCQSACKGESTLFIEYRTHVSTPGLKVYEYTQAVVLHGMDSVYVTLNVRSGLSQVEDIIRDVDDFYNEIENISKDLSTCELESDRLELLQDGRAEKKLHSILEELYDKFLQPILTNHLLVGRLEPNATIVIVPDKALYRVPFALLRDKTTKKHLFQLHKIAIVPSLRVLPHCERRLRHLDRLQLKLKCILAVGNPAFNESTTTLSGTAEELKMLRNCFGEERMETLEEGEATRANLLKLVKEADASSDKHALAVIHLGVHGHWDKFKPGDDEREKKYKTGSLQFARPPQRSDVGLMIGTAQNSPQLQTSDLVTEMDFESEAGTSADNHRLSAEDQEMLSSEDILEGGFQWPTRLAVLSACNSSRGQSYTDGEVNLPRALMIKGIPAAVVSQWKVSDKSSPKLMKEFYENLKHGQDVVTAMQSAMIQLSGDPASSIFDWGSFLVWGLPTVQLPLELCTENAQRTQPTRQHAVALKRETCRLVWGDLKVALFDMLRSVDNILDAATKSRVFDMKLLTDAIVRLWRIECTPLLLVDASSRTDQNISENILKETRSLSEGFYDLILEEFTPVECELKNRCDPNCMIYFWEHVMRKHVIRSNYEIALGYSIKIRDMIEDGHPDTLFIFFVSAVLLRLTGSHFDALVIFDRLLAIKYKENYEMLVQTSYVKHLMEDENGALVYALRAKKVAGNAGDLDTKWFKLAPFPDSFQQWLSNVDDRSWTPAVAAREQVIELIWRLHSCGTNLPKQHYYKKQLYEVDIFLKSAHNNCAPIITSEIIEVIYAVERLQQELPADDSSLTMDIIAIAEEFYRMIPVQQSSEIELGLEKAGTFNDIILFRLRLMYVQAMKGNHEIALRYADNAMEVVQNADGWKYELWVRRERAVILRLLQRYDEAYEELHRVLECAKEDFACLIQMSYLEELRNNQAEASEYARQAKTWKSADMSSPGFGAFQLALMALPDDYR